MEHKELTVLSESEVKNRDMRDALTAWMATAEPGNLISFGDRDDAKVLVCVNQVNVLQVKHVVQCEVR